MKRIVLVGLGAGLLLLGLYFGILTLLQGLQHATEQSAKLWYWLILMAAGFGLQAGLFDFIRRNLRRRRVAVASVSTSGGVSAGSMAACCAHHLADVLPFVGLSGLAAVLANYQTFFLVLGLMSNLVGIAIMLETLQRHRLGPVMGRVPFSMGRVRNGTIVSAALVSLAALFLTIGAGT